MISHDLVYGYLVYEQLLAAITLSICNINLSLKWSQFCIKKACNFMKLFQYLVRFMRRLNMGSQEFPHPNGIMRLIGGVGPIEWTTINQ